MNNQKIPSLELEPLINYNGLNVELFIQKNNHEGIEFYYIGQLTSITHKQVYRTVSSLLPTSSLKSTMKSRTSFMVISSMISTLHLRIHNRHNCNHSHLHMNSRMYHRSPQTFLHTLLDMLLLISD